MLAAKMSTLHINALKDFLDQLPHGGVKALAQRLRVHPVYLSQLAARQGGRKPSPKLCIDIERETGGAIKRRELRPDDWHEIWPLEPGSSVEPTNPSAPLADIPPPPPGQAGQPTGAAHAA
jgi:DNA-binding transcriptional regulator YdaS (Cro superfamily)